MVPTLPDFRSPEFLLGHVRHTLSFYEGRCLDPSGGFFHFFRDDGRVYDAHTRHLVSSTRFIFNQAMAYRRFGAEARLAAVRHGLDFLQQAHAQPRGGYAWQLDWRDGRATVQDGTNHCYGLAFVLLAHAHAVLAGVQDAAHGLEATWQLMEHRFWEPAHGLYADEATPRLEDQRLPRPERQHAQLRGHAGCVRGHGRRQVPGPCRDPGTQRHPTPGRPGGRAGLGTLPRHAQGWAVDEDYNREDKTNIFRPWGFQTGHLTEWAKLLMQLERHRPGTWMLPTARHFFDTAMRLGWDAEHGGLVYGFCAGRPGL